jgi:para-aminobenzoate synthetase / 4-amino-4-deoxychorismate lyase
MIMRGARADRKPPLGGAASLVRVALAAELDPTDASLLVRGDERPFALSGEWAGGGALIGSDPVCVAPPDADPFAVLDLQPAVAAALEGWPEAPRARSLPEGAVGGGWFGSLGYNLGALVERLPPPPPRRAVLPAFELAFYDHLLRRDAEGRWWFEALWTKARDPALRRRLGLLSKRLAEPLRRRRLSVGSFAAAPPGAAGHLAAVRECRDRIAAGEIFQANLCMRLEATFSGDPLDLFAKAAGALAPPYAALITGARGSVCSLSPELFLRRCGREVVTRPIKGTAARGDFVADTGRELLAGSAKDRAENVMIVDLMRNDLGRVCEPGTIEVAELAVPRPAPGVWHLVSTVTGTLRDGTGDAALLRAAFPPGSVTGAPKIQAMRVISELEATGRESYTGAVGYASPLAGLELNVAIRTLESRGDRLWLGAGGGIVADSVPEDELRECMLKAGPIVAAAGGALAGERAARGAARRAAGLGIAERPDPARGVFETVLVRDGVPVNADAHLDRLERSIEELYGCSLPVDVAERLAFDALSWPRARLRVFAVPAAGAIEVEIATGALGDERDGGAPALRPFVVPGGLGAHKWADRRLLEALADRGRAVPLIVDLDGAALEAGHANLFIAERGRLLTPALDGRLLPGTVRAELIASLRRLGIEVGEQPLSLDRVEAAEAILLSSSIRGVRAAQLEGRAAGARPLGPELREALAEAGYPLEPTTASPETIAGTGGRSSRTRIT